MDPEGVTAHRLGSLPTNLTAANIDGIVRRGRLSPTGWLLRHRHEGRGAHVQQPPPTTKLRRPTTAGGDEDSDNTYNVVVVAADASGNRGYHKVTVKVTNVAEHGEGHLDRRPRRQWRPRRWSSQSRDADGAVPGRRNPDRQKRPMATYPVTADGKGVTGDHNLTWLWKRGGTLHRRRDRRNGYTVIDRRHRQAPPRRGVLHASTATQTRGVRVPDLRLPGAGVPVRSSNEAPEFSPTTITREVSRGR